MCPIVQNTDKSPPTGPSKVPAFTSNEWHMHTAFFPSYTALLFKEEEVTTSVTRERELCPTLSSQPAYPRNFLLQRPHPPLSLPPPSSTSFTSPISFLPRPNHPSHLLLHISPVPTLATSLTSLSHSLPTYIHTITKTQKLQTLSKKLSDPSFTHSFIRSFYAQNSTFIPPLPSPPFPSLPLDSIFR